MREMGSSPMETRPAPMATAPRLGFVEATQSHPKATAPAHPRVPSCADSRTAKHSSTQPELSGSEGMRSPLLNPAGMRGSRGPRRSHLAPHTHACVHTHAQHTHVYPLPQVTCVHVYTHARAHPINHMHVYTDTHMWVHMHTHKPHVCAHMHPWTCTHTHVHVHTPTHTHVLTHTHTTHTHKPHTYTCSCNHAHIHAHTETHTCTLINTRTHALITHRHSCAHPSTNHVHVHAPTNHTHTCPFINIHKCIHAIINPEALLHTHAHTQMLTPAGGPQPGEGRGRKTEGPFLRGSSPPSLPSAPASRRPFCVGEGTSRAAPSPWDSVRQPAQSQQAKSRAEGGWPTRLGARLPGRRRTARRGWGDQGSQPGPMLGADESTSP